MSSDLRIHGARREPPHSDGTVDGAGLKASKQSAAERTGERTPADPHCRRADGHKGARRLLRACEIRWKTAWVFKPGPSEYS